VPRNSAVGLIRKVRLGLAASTYKQSQNAMMRGQALRNSVSGNRPAGKVVRERVHNRNSQSRFADNVKLEGTLPRVNTALVLIRGAPVRPPLYWTGRWSTRWSSTAGHVRRVASPGMGRAGKKHLSRTENAVNPEPLRPSFALLGAAQDRRNRPTNLRCGRRGSTDC